MISAAFLLITLPALAAPPEASGEWMKAEPSRTDLPAIEVAVGYPGGYIPADDVPIVLRAKPDRAFEGAIGLRFVLRWHPSPVIYRVSMKPGQPWELRTWTSTRGGESQLNIEWRDRDLNVLSTAPVARIRPHRHRVLRVVTDAATAPAETLGEPTYAVTPAELAREAQWYEGFAALAIPTASWLDLPPVTREAIFGSAIPIVFVGFPRKGQTITARDELLLPVSFLPQPAAYRVPWPYGSSDVSIPAPMSWKADAGASALGSPDLPWFVSEGLTVAWAADDKVLAGPPPALQIVGRIPSQGNPVVPDAEKRPAARQFLRVYVPMIVTILAALLSLALWLVSRRAPRIAVAAVAIGSSLLIIAAEKRIRPLPDHHEIEVIVPLSPGLVQRYHGRFDAGLAPLQGATTPPDVTSWVHWMDRVDGQGQIPGPILRDEGNLFGSTDVEATMRWSSRRDAGSGAAVTIVRRDPSSMTLRFDAPHPVNEIRARWYEDRREVGGEIRLNGSRSGEVTIRAGHFIWKEGARFTDDVGIAGDEPRSVVTAGGTTVWLVERTRVRTKVTRWIQPRSGDPNEVLRIAGWMRRGAADPPALSGTFVLPAGGLEQRAASVIVPTTVPVDASVVVAWPGGSAAATSVRSSDIRIREYAIAEEALKQIAASGGVVQVSIRSANPPVGSSASIELRRKS